MRFFTPEEANEALTVIEPLVERLVRLRAASLEIDGQLDVLRAKVSGNGGTLDPRKLAGLEAAAAKADKSVRALVAKLHGLGVQVKDPDTGLVDFPAQHPADGATVLLCWKLGEEAVGHWHPVEAGFAGRKPLPF